MAEDIQKAEMLQKHQKCCGQYSGSGEEASEEDDIVVQLNSYDYNSSDEDTQSVSLQAV